ncbi:NAD(P)/FAD-dependent oxidoreductase [Desulfotomaculum nigrificans]|uniref:NAD(P)/FAD-dependent oxidoreductase n=1 Tax=Desulfotomaculum nigrificans TaxID=1565 RepID=UPI0001FAE05D|nr:hypothetical protein [Desulfotomaculum nigrificans]
MEILHKTSLSGRVKKFKVGNVLLAGRAGGLTDRLMGSGSVEALISGIMAARSIINGENYNDLVKQ